MIDGDRAEIERALARIKSQAASGTFRVTQHGQQEMVEEAIRLDEVLQAIGRSEMLENYPEHRRGACCLLGGATDEGVPSISFAPSGLPC